VAYPARLWTRRATVTLVALAMATLALVARADAFVYWASSSTNSIGRANLDGTGANQSFITTANDPNAVAVNGAVAVDAAHVYWANTGTPPNFAYRIGRANIDGTGANQSFILSPSAVTGVAVDAGHVYWSQASTGTIGRANLDGTGVNQRFISGAGTPHSLAVDGAHIYWADFDTIGRANIDGTGVDKSFITGADVATGVAVDSAYVYWANLQTQKIGRANLNGTGVDQSFIFVSCPCALFGLAVDASHVYWGDHASNTIGRANIDHSFVFPNFITGAVAPSAVAVDGLVAPGPQPPPTIADLAASVHALGLPHGLERSLMVKLVGAQRKHDAGHDAAACNTLGAFLNEVNAQKKIGAGAAALSADARAVRDSLGCGSS
jgi:virginiamycin B lyase